MQTLIKWPGGKTSEIPIIKNFIPIFDRYIEPFFGGGALFFYMSPQKSIINDISSNLMTFYSYIKSGNKKFSDCLYGINEEWNLLKQLAAEQAPKISLQYKSYKNNNFTKNEFVSYLNKICKDSVSLIASNSSVISDEVLLYNELTRMVCNKVFRTIANEVKFTSNLKDDDLIKNIITGFTGGYYMYMRTMLNRMEKDINLYTENEFKIAVFYFVREFCYGSMFRYNKSGEFNIPYGGIGYNNKDFKKKIDLLFDIETKKHFTDTTIRIEDFTSIIDKAQESDFIFLDPPYDTDFSDYEDRAFAEIDQRRLAKQLHDTKAKFLLIIKNSPLIEELYKNNGFRVFAFDNKYSYCVKGRNDRNAVHLIVTNYDLDKNL